MHNQYTTLSEAIKHLNQRGYTLDFNTEPERIFCKNTKKGYRPDEFQIDEHHRFEGMTNPGDMSIVFAITTRDGSKGTLTDAYGTYGDKPGKAMVEKLSLHKD